MKKIIFKKVVRVNNFFIFYFNKLNEFIKIINHKFKNISSFNRYLIFLIIILFLYLFFLSIPSLYNKGPLQTKLNKQINKEFNTNISLSSKIKYNILPTPHFLIEDVKFYTNELEMPKELAQIKKLKVFISQKYFFKKDKIEIVKISLLSLVHILCTFGLVFLFPQFIYEYNQENIINLDKTFLYCLVFLAIFPSIGSYYCWAGAVSIIGPNRAGIFLSLIPLFSTIMAIFFFDEKFQFYHFIGSILVIIGLILANKKIKYVKN